VSMSLCTVIDRFRDYCMAMVEKRHLDDLRRVSYTQGRRYSVSSLLFVE
jgi:hypothetical protein